MLLWSHEVWQFQIKVHGSKLYFLQPTVIVIKNIKLLKKVYFLLKEQGMTINGVKKILNKTINSLCLS